MINRQTFLTTETRFLNKVPANQIQQHIKRNIPHDGMGFSPGMQTHIGIHKSISVMHHINRVEDKSHVTISLDAKKMFDKI